jgi:WD40 repeat protein
MKKFPLLPSILIVSALRGLLFLAAVLVLVQPCAGGPGVFVSTGNLGVARSDHTATLLPSGRVLVTGGRGPSGTAIASAELYDPASGSWTVTGNLGTSRYNHSATLLPNGKVLVAGGYDSSARASAELYDPASGTWTATGSLGIPRQSHSATLLPNGKVLVAGGFNGVITAVATAELYDPASGTWAATGNLTTARGNHGATLLSNGNLLVTGGFGEVGIGAFGTLASAELYDPAGGSWAPTGRLATPNYVHTATLLPSGKVLVAGGLTDPGPTASAQLYDPASGTWTATGNLGTSRYGHTATLLPNGKVLVTAGKNGSNTASAELYDPASGTWTATGGLASARSFHRATLLPNGMVLISAGTDGSRADAFASAELYDQGPPFITSPLVASGIVGLPYTYQFTASGATSLQIAGPVPPGLTFNTSLGALTGIPTAAGVFPVGLSATNAQGTTNAALTITVQGAPSGLVIISSSCATGRTGRPFNFQLKTKGGSSATHFAVDGLPPGFDLDPSTGFISGTPNPDGSFRLAVSAIDGAATTNATLQLTFTSDPTVPIITSPATAILAPGQSFTYSITADANGTFGYIGGDGIVHQAPSPSCAGLPAGLCFDGNHTISGTFNPPFGADRRYPTRPDQTGGIITNVQLFAANPPNGTSIISLFPVRRASGLTNIATRLRVGTGDNVLIGGFIIAESVAGSGGPKKVIIRAIGPSLAQFNVPDALQDPTLELRDGAGSLLGANGDWSDAQGQANQILDAHLEPRDDREAAIVAYLNPGQYTAIVGGKNDTMGNGLVEVYDLGTVVLADTSNSRLANIATRGKVLGGDSRMIGGLIIANSSTRVVVRAIGPSLALLGITGALPDPTLALKDANGETLIENDDWGSDPVQAAEIQQRMLAPTNPCESALVTTLQPGQYTAIVSGKGSATGVAVVEGYALSGP